MCVFFSNGSLCEVLLYFRTYRIHEGNLCSAAPGLSARGARLKAAEARAPRQRHVAHVGRAKQAKDVKGLRLEKQ